MDTLIKEDYRTLPLQKITEKKTNMNINAKIPSQTLANLIQQCIKTIMYHNQVGFILLLGWINIQKAINIIHINKQKKKNHITISIDIEKAFDKNPTPIHNKNCQ